ADAVSEVPVLGWLPQADFLGIPERHLGLFTAKEHVTIDRIRTIGDFFRKRVNIENILKVLPQTNLQGLSSQPAATGHRRVPLAGDKAFSFYSHANRLELERAGAEIVEFSPLTDAEIPESDFLYIGGGYPELYREQLEANVSMRMSIRRFIESGRRFYAECGGLMYLARSIDRSEMVGVVPAEIRMTERLVDFGYSEITTSHESILGPAGTKARGHQFHYSCLAGH